MYRMTNVKRWIFISSLIVFHLYVNVDTASQDEFYYVPSVFVRDFSDVMDSVGCIHCLGGLVDNCR